MKIGFGAAVRCREPGCPPAPHWVWRFLRLSRASFGDPGMAAWVSGGLFVVLWDGPLAYEWPTHGPVLGTWLYLGPRVL